MILAHNDQQYFPVGVFIDGEQSRNSVMAYTNLSYIWSKASASHPGVAGSIVS